MTDDISKVVMRVLQCPCCPTSVETQATGTVECLRCGAAMEVDSSAKARGFMGEFGDLRRESTPAEVGEVDAAASNLNLAAVHAKPEHKPLIVGAIGLIRTLARQLAEAKERMRELEGFREYAELLKHKVITCGVAARHPDPSLSRTGAYAGKWNSPQAEDVRALRDRAEQAESQLAEAKAEIAALSDDVAEYQRNIDAESFALTKAESALAEATRRLGEVEGLLRECQRRLGAEESLRHMTYREWSELDDRIDAALTKEPPHGS